MGDLKLSKKEIKAENYFIDQGKNVLSLSKQYEPIGNKQVPMTHREKPVPNWSKDDWETYQYDKIKNSYIDKDAEVVQGNIRNKSIPDSEIPKDAIYLRDTDDDKQEAIGKMQVKYNVSPDIENINKAKQNYFNYLDSPYYQQTAKNMWNEDSGKYIDEQKDIIQATPINTLGRGMSQKDKIQWLGDGAQMGFYDPSLKTVTNASGDTVVSSHELSHATDSNKDIPYDLFLPKKIGNDGRIPIGRDLNPKYAEDLDKLKSYLKLPAQYDKWQNKEFKAESEYLSKPTEVRARVNSIRSKMVEDSFDWNKSTSSEIKSYLEKQENPLIKQQVEELKFLKEDELSDLLKNYAKNKELKNKNIA